MRCSTPSAGSSIVSSPTDCEASQRQSRPCGRALDVRLSSDPDTIHQARVSRTVPGLTHALPSRALATEGGGRYALDPTAPRDQILALEPVLLLDLALEKAPKLAVYGERAYVRFNHGETPLAAQIYRTGVRVFLKYFSSLDAGI